MSETPRQRVERIVGEELERILDDIWQRDGLPEFARAAGMERFREGMRNTFRFLGPSDEGIKQLASLTDDELRQGARGFFEPQIKEALADVRPN